MLIATTSTSGVRFSRLGFYSKSVSLYNTCISPRLDALGGSSEGKMPTMMYRKMPTIM